MSLVKSAGGHPEPEQLDVLALFVGVLERGQQLGGTEYLSCPIEQDAPETTMFSGNVQTTHTSEYSGNPDQQLYNLLKR